MSKMSEVEIHSAAQSIIKRRTDEKSRAAKERLGADRYKKRSEISNVLADRVLTKELLEAYEQ